MVMNKSSHPRWFVSTSRDTSRSDTTISDAPANTHTKMFVSGPLSCILAEYAEKNTA